MRRLGDILNTPTERVTIPAAPHFRPCRARSVSTASASATAPDRAEVLRNIDLKIEVGEVIGIVGRSGSGKEHIDQADPATACARQRQVLIDGIDLGLVEPAWLRRHRWAWCCRRIFSLTAPSAITSRLPQSWLAMEQIVRASPTGRRARVHTELAEGMTRWSESAATLSGGQRQRIAWRAHC